MLQKSETLIEKFIFASRWMQLPIYLGLVVGAIFYTYKFLIELIHLVTEVNALSETVFMLGILTLVDVSMVINLLIIVIIGGYTTFVSKIVLSDHVDKPEWLDKINAGTLKVKLAVSLVGVSGIHLLKIFININNTPNEKIMLQILIHFVFLVSAVMLAYTDKLLHTKH